MLFDLDDTLLDFTRAEEVAFGEVMKQAGAASGGPELLAFYREANRELWSQFEQKQVTKDFLVVERFRRVVQKGGLRSDPAELNAEFLRVLSTTDFHMPGAEQVCQHFRSHCRLGIVTNGIDLVQRERLRRSGLSDYFEFLASSEAAGFAKPDERIFRYALNQCAPVSSLRFEEVLMIGDRVETDIVGANRVGMLNCWLNLGARTDATREHPSSGESAGRSSGATFEINQLSDLIQLPLFSSIKGRAENA